METYTEKQLEAAFHQWLGYNKANRADEWDKFRTEVELFLNDNGNFKDIPHRDQIAYEVLEFLPPLGEFGTDNDPFDNPEWWGQIISQITEYVGDAWPEVA